LVWEPFHTVYTHQREFTGLAAGDCVPTSDLG